MSIAPSLPAVPVSGEFYLPTLVKVHVPKLEEELERELGVRIPFLIDEPSFAASACAVMNAQTPHGLHRIIDGILLAGSDFVSRRLLQTCLKEIRVKNVENSFEVAVTYNLGVLSIFGAYQHAWLGWPEADQIREALQAPF